MLQKITKTLVTEQLFKTSYHCWHKIKGILITCGLNKK